LILHLLSFLSPSFFDPPKCILFFLLPLFSFDSSLSFSLTEVDPFDRRDEEKREKLNKQKKNELRNRVRGEKEDLKQLPGVMSINNNVPRPDKGDIKTAIEVARTATASVGKFQAILPGEKIKTKPKKVRTDFQCYFSYFSCSSFPSPALLEFCLHLTLSLLFLAFILTFLLNHLSHFILPPSSSPFFLLYFRSITAKRRKRL
jgi:hypothetical protein